MKLYALMVRREYEDHVGYESLRWNDEQLVGLFYTHESAENARESLIKDVMKDDKHFRSYLWDREGAIAERSLTIDGDPLVLWYDDIHHDEFALICRIKEFETGELYTEAL